MKTISQKTNCLALTVRKEHRLMVINKAVTGTMRIASKALFGAVVLTLLNMVV